ncbi:C-type lectin 1 [Dissostichus eleginoides]|uniref:C-type lectin 1 n=1 Tax=Dissostichus eleginoides TaxID=100907 RepID=A0AAD9CTC0_DISEL|nr:C-type lectin 1 [Dissostichus eleginoides]
MALLVFLLCSGLFHFTLTSHQLRIFYFKTTRSVWSEALEECYENNESPVTLYDEEDEKFTYKFQESNRGPPPLWLGLSKSRNLTWSNGNNVNFTESLVNLTKGEQICEAIDNDTWTGYNCSEKKHFMCSKDDTYTLIEKEEDWCHALKYCRTHHSDLVSIHNETENGLVLEKGNNRSFWIGLMHDEWEWQDKGCSSFRKWRPPTHFRLDSDEEKECTTYTNGEMDAQECDQLKNPFCSKGDMRIRVINKNFTWEEAFNYCETEHSGLLSIEDKEDQYAVEQWLKFSEFSDGVGPFWIALRQSRVFGFWIWRDSVVSYKNWKNGSVPVPPSSHICGVISDKTDNYTWTDENCLLRHPFLCEEEIVYMDKRYGFDG